MDNGSKRRVSLRVALAIIVPAVSFTVLTSTAQAATHTVPASVDPTGRQDVTRQLNAFIAGVPDGSTVSFPAGATYRIEGVFAIEGRHDLDLEFNGSRLIADTDGSGVEPHYPIRQYWPRHRAHLYISGSSGIQVRDLVVRGPNAAGGTGDDAWQVQYEAQHAVEVNQSQDVLIEGCDLSEIYGDGVYIGRHSERVRVHDCYIHHNGRQGIAVTGARDVVLENNNLQEIRRTAFDLEPNSDWYLENIRIQNNRVGKARGNFVSGHGTGSTFTDIHILDNAVSGEMEINMRAPEGTRRGSVEIRGNHSTLKFGSPHALITAVGYDDVTIAANASPFDGRSGGLAVSVLEGCSVNIYDNAFTNVETQEHVTLTPHCAPPGSSTQPPKSQSPLIRIGTAHVVERGAR